MTAVNVENEILKSKLKNKKNPLLKNQIVVNTSKKNIKN